MSPIKLVCLDFDGTVMVYDEEPGFFHPDAIAAINKLCDAGVEWCTNSGRTFEGQMEILDLTRRKGLRHMPSAMICSESYLYERRNGGYVGAEPWNGRARKRLVAYHVQVQTVICRHLDDWRIRYRPDVYMGEEYTAFNVMDTNGTADRFYAEVGAAVAGIAGGMATRNGGWVVLLPEEVGKGNVLRAYLALRGWSAEHALAVGDHFNDLSMLDGSSARFVGCPANAVTEVAETVAKAGGCVAGSEGAQGTVEVMRFFLGDQLGTV
jgi:hydroxymethylpyrimidine pyrophosphatase-like HAD family hydrolase